MARTIELLQPLFAKPRLTDKLLAKPPFRFLHDIVSAVREASGGVFADGLFTAAELTAEGAGESRESKIAYLDKLINFLGLHLGTHLGVHAGKVVVGAEAENTNEMLQLLAIAASSRLPTADAVRAVLAGEVQVGEDGTPAGGAPAAPPPAPAPAPAAAPPARESAPPMVAAPRPVAATAAAAAPSPSAVVASGGGGGGGGGEDGGGAARFVRPKTAQRRPPKIRDNVTASATVVGGGPGGGAPAGLLAEGDDSDGEGGGGGEGKADDDGGGFGFSAAAFADGGGGQGKHTRDILGGGGERGGMPGTSPTAEEDGGIRMGRIKRATGGAGGGGRGGSGYTAAELEALRGAIQKLCSSTNPLGKSMDYLTEDVDDMRTELRTWRAEYKKSGAYWGWGTTGGATTHDSTRHCQ